MWLLNVIKSTRNDKRYMGIYCMCEKKNSCKGSNHKLIHFGSPPATTYIDGASEQKKDAYIARHSKVKGEDFNKPMTAGSLARWILWGSTRSIRENVKKFRTKFGV